MAGATALLYMLYKCFLFYELLLFHYGSLIFFFYKCTRGFINVNGKKKL